MPRPARSLAVPWAGAVDADVEALGRDPGDPATQLAVVEQDPVAHLGGVEHLRQGAADAGPVGRRPPAPGVQSRVRCRISPSRQRDPLFGRRQVTDRGGVVGADHHVHRAGADVGGLLHGDHEPAGPGRCQQ